MESLSPMGRLSTVKGITDAVIYLTDSATVAGDILYVDGGAHFGRRCRLARLRWFKHCKSFAGLRYILVDAD
jgi:hypothetical protein